MSALKFFAGIALLGAAAIAAAEAGNSLHALNDAELRGVSTPIPAPASGAL